MQFILKKRESFVRCKKPFLIRTFGLSRIGTEPALDAAEVDTPALLEKPTTVPEFIVPPQLPTPTEPPVTVAMVLEEV